jgi:hypothetical protein
VEAHAREVHDVSLVHLHLGGIEAHRLLREVPLLDQPADLDAEDRLRARVDDRERGGAENRYEDGGGGASARARGS